MKSKSIVLSALLALVAVASAHAQITSNLTDLVLGFGKSSGTGSTSNLEVSLGNVSNFKTGGTYATGSEVFLSQLSVADLNSTYGTSPTGTTGWKTSATSWAVVGTNGAGGGNTLWATQGTPELPGSSQGSGANTIATLNGDLNGRIATANSAFSTVVATAETNSWKNIAAGGTFNYFSATNLRNNSALSGALPSTIGFYEYVESAAATVQLGTFKLYNDGGFSFTSFAAIPEPSTYAAILGVATLGFAALRRRKQSLVA